MIVTLELFVETDCPTPAFADFQRWVNAALAHKNSSTTTHPASCGSIEVVMDPATSAGSYAVQPGDMLPGLVPGSITIEQKLPSKNLATNNLSIKLIDTETMQTLNRTYRNKDKPTNVLSFPYQAFPGEKESYLGDIAICAPVVITEVEQQHKDITAHWAHLTIHGVLHLLGYDHETEADAAVMMPLESHLLIELGFSCPYA